MNPTTTETTTPAAWIGCLACYNNGQLRGKWITAQRAADEMTADGITYGDQAETITTHNLGTPYTAPRCRKCGGDEFDVFDTQHTPNNCRTLREFYANAEQLAYMTDEQLERINVLAAWLGGSPSLDDLTTYDDDNYVGQYDTFQDYAETYADEVALLADTPEWIARYFDMEAFSRDLAHDFYHDDTTGHTWRSC